MSYYRLYADRATDHVVKGSSPAKALRELCAAAGLTLASQDGRYGRTSDGQSVSALTEPWSYSRQRDHGTTRLA